MAQLPVTKPIDAPDDSVRIASYNVRAFYQSENAARQIAAWSKQEGIDVLCMQEIRKPAEWPISTLFSNVFFAPKWSGYCVGIFSKYPIVYEELLEFKELSGDGYPKYSAGLADIALPWDTVRFINVHLSSTGVSDGDMSVEPNADDVIVRTKDIINKLIRSERARGLGRGKSTSSGSMRRFQQCTFGQSICAVIAKNGGPIYLAWYGKNGEL